MNVKRMLKNAILNMKCQHTRMLCISLYCLMTAGCGKKIQNSSEDSEKSAQPLFTHSYALKAKLFANGDSIIDGKKFDENAWVKIPSQLDVTHGNAGNQEAKVYFYYEEDSALFCIYKGGAASQNPEENDDVTKGLKYKFKGCFEDVNHDGFAEEINYQPGQEIPLESGAEVILEVVGADDRFDNETQAELDVEFL